MSVRSGIGFVSSPARTGRRRSICCALRRRWPAPKPTACRRESLLDVSRRDLARLTGVPAEQTRPEQLAALQYTGPQLPDRNRLVRGRSARKHERWRFPGTSSRPPRPGPRQPAARACPARTSREPARSTPAPHGDRAGEWNLGLRLTVPLFTGGRLSSGIVAAEAQQQAAAEIVRLAELQISGQIDRAVSALVGCAGAGRKPRRRSLALREDRASRTPRGCGRGQGRSPTTCEPKRIFWRSARG